MMTARQQLAARVLRETIVPALDVIGLGGRAATELVLGTGIQESRLLARRQLDHGPARGLWQMESATFWDLWNNFVGKNAQLRADMLQITHGKAATHELLVANDPFSAAMCRVLYRRVSAPLPDAGDLRAQAAYWKKYYNTPLGAGRESEYIKNWQLHITDTTFTELKV